MIVQQWTVCCRNLLNMHVLVASEFSVTHDSGDIALHQSRHALLGYATKTALVLSHHSIAH